MRGRIDPHKVAIYIRWSTEDQGLGHTLEIQRESCQYYCLSQGWSIREELLYIDDGCSGSSLARPALTRLRQAVAGGAVDCVVVYKLDRLSRNITDMINLVLDEWEERCSVRSTQEPVDTTTDAGRMFFTLLGSFADFERASIKSRTWSGKRKNAEKGRNPGIPYAFGYEKGETGQWTVCEPEAVIIRRIYADYIRGRSCAMIAAALNRLGMATRSGGRWASADISRIIRNPLYAGRLVYNRRGRGRRPGSTVAKPASEVVTCEGAAPAIVDPADWALAERVRQERPGPGRGAPARTGASPFLLAGLVRCPCGHNWVGIRGGRRGERFYACGGARAKGPSHCASRLVLAEPLERYVLQRAAALWPLRGGLTVSLARVRQEQAELQQVRLAALMRGVTSLQSQLARFRQDYRSGRLPAQEYVALARECREELEQARVQLAEAQAHKEAAPAVDSQGAAGLVSQCDPWKCLEQEELKQVLRLLVGQIRLERSKGSADARLHLTWRLPPGEPPGSAGAGLVRAD